MTDANGVYWLSAAMALAQIGCVAVALGVLDRLSWRDRLGLGCVGAGTVFSLWMGLIPNGVLENWPFIIGRFGVLVVIEANYGPAVRKQLAASWTLGRLASMTESDEERDELTRAFAAPVMQYGVRPPEGTTILPATEKR